MAWEAQCDVEEALHENWKLTIASVDYQKYFDSFPVEWTHGFMLELGVPSALADMTAELYGNLTRTIRFGRALGQPFHPQRGLGQGDSMSLIPALALVSCQFRYLDDVLPNVKKSACVDDRIIRGPMQDVLEAMRLMSEFDEACGQRLRHDKTVISATDPKERAALKKIRIGGSLMKVDLIDKVVGTTINTALRESRAAGNAKVDKAVQTCWLIGTSAVFAARKIKAVTSKVIPSVLYGLSWAFPSVARCKRLRQAILGATWGFKRKMRCMEAVFGILFKPTSVEPWCALSARTLMDTRRLLRKSKPRRIRFIKMLTRMSKKANITKSRSLKVSGPVGAAIRAADNIGCRIRAKGHDIQLIPPVGLPVDLLHDDPHTVKHHLESAARVTVLNNLSIRVNGKTVDHRRPPPSPVDTDFVSDRKDFVGISSYIDHEATTANLRLPQRSGGIRYKDDPLARTTLRSIIAGSIRGLDRLLRAGLVNSSICPCVKCNGAVADTEHILWHCHEYHSIRKKGLKQIEDYCSRLMPWRAALANDFMSRPSFICCGVCNDKPESANLGQYRNRNDPIHEEPVKPEEIISEPPSGDFRTVEIDDRTFLIVYTDGAAFHSDSPRFAHAGWGVYYAEGSNGNSCGPLYGHRQCSFRAELRAVLQVLRTAAYPTVIKCDCQSVVDVVRSLINDPFGNIPHKNADMWSLIRDLLQGPQLDRIRIEWMPSHTADNKAKAERSCKLLYDALDVKGNDGADQLAKDGAIPSQPDNEAWVTAQDRMVITRMTQDLMVEVWMAHRKTTGKHDDMELDEAEMALLEMSVNPCDDADEQEDEDPWGDGPCGLDGAMHPSVGPCPAALREFRNIVPCDRPPDQRGEKRRELQPGGFSKKPRHDDEKLTDAGEPCPSMRWKEVDSIASSVLRDFPNYFPGRQDAVDTIQLEIREGHQPPVSAIKGVAYTDGCDAQCVARPSHEAVLPLIEWWQSLVWTRVAASNGLEGTITFLELVLDFFLTSGQLPGAREHPLEAQAKLLVKMVRHWVCKFGLRVNGRSSSFAEAFRPRLVATIQPLTKRIAVPGLMRRPQWSDGRRAQVAALIILADRSDIQVLGTHGVSAFQVGHTFRLKHLQSPENGHVDYVAQSRDLIAAITAATPAPWKSRRKLPMGPCAKGCLTSAKYMGRDSWWHQMPSGEVLCHKHYCLLQRNT